jgi:hypothetical protein
MPSIAKEELTIRNHFQEKFDSVEAQKHPVDFLARQDRSVMMLDDEE